MLKIQEVGIGRLIPWECNPRENDHAVEAVVKSTNSFGFNVPIICDQNFTIVAGHTRLKAAQQMNMGRVPVIQLELTDTQRKAFSIADNKTAEIANWDFPKLRDILEELRGEDIKFGDLGFSADEIRRLIFSDTPNENEVPEINEEPLTKPGDLYTLGKHRLLCGDSRDNNSVKLLTNGEKVDHIFGGPPCFNQQIYAQWVDYQSYISDMRTIIENCLNYLKDGGIIVWNIANDCSTNHDLASDHSRLMKKGGAVYLDTIAWVKSGANYTIPRNLHIRRNHCYYPAFQWEPLLVFQKPGDMPKMSREGVKYMLQYQTNVWEVPAITHQMEIFSHPAVCPVEIPYRSLLAYTNEKGSVFEPFGGSGTTLIAAEKASRKAFIMERIPAYCDATVIRWEKFTGNKAERMMR